MLFGNTFPFCDFNYDAAIHFNQILQDFPYRFSFVDLGLGNSPCSVFYKSYQADVTRFQILDYAGETFCD